MLEKKDIETMIKEKMDLYCKQYGKNFKFAVIEILSLEKMLNPSSEEKPPRLIPLAKWEQYHTDYTVRALRQFYFYREQNGFEECVEYGGNNGGRILINEDKFYKWQEKRSKMKKLKTI